MQAALANFFRTGLISLIAGFTLGAASLPGPAVDENRSEIFYTSDEQKHIAETYIQQLTDAKVFRSHIVTKVAALQAFYPAEAYHKNYVARNPHQPYVAYNDLPKLTNLHAEFPELLKGAKQ